MTFDQDRLDTRRAIAPEAFADEVNNGEASREAFDRIALDAGLSLV